jgi:hypothetical protein
MRSIIVIGVIASLNLTQPLELGSDLTTITIVPEDDANLHRLIRSIAADPNENIVLRLSGLEARDQSGASWEVRIAPADNVNCDAAPSLVGHLSSFGITPGTEFVYRLDEAIPAAHCIGLKVIFEPTSGIEVSGIPEATTVCARLRISRITLETDSVANRPNQ